MDGTTGPLPPGQPRDVMVAVVGAGLGHLDEGACVVVACSGGPDSTALAYLTAEARPDLRLTLVHVRHGLRDDAADVEVVRRHASWLGVDLSLEPVEVVARGEGPEAAARASRYRALRAVARRIRAATILVGHTADDQAETVLLRVARGTGIDGLASMAGVSGDLTRPLLRVRREDVRRFVTMEGLPTVEDPTNRDPAIRRSLVRHHVLPTLGRVGPDPVAALVRLADLARADAEALDQAAAPLLAEVRWTGRAASLPAARLLTSPRSLAARVVRSVIAELSGRAPSAAVVGRVLDDVDVPAASLPAGLELTRTTAWWTLAPRNVTTSPPILLPERGAVRWPPAGRVVRVLAPSADEVADGSGQLPLQLVGAWTPPRLRLADEATPPGATADRLIVWLPEGCHDLEVRHRRPGDRITTPGGTKRVGQVAAEAGMPRPLRARWPVVASGTRVVWVPGLAVDRAVLANGRAAPARLVVVDLDTDPDAAGGAGRTDGGGR